MTLGQLLDILTAIPGGWQNAEVFFTDGLRPTEIRAVLLTPSQATDPDDDDGATVVLTCGWPAPPAPPPVCECDPAAG